MIQIPAAINLEKLRKEALISQSEMAERLGVSQSQVSRYEQNPDEVPYGIVRKWFKFCGFVSNLKGLEISDPLVGIQERIKLLHDYGQTEPEIPADLADGTPTANAQSLIQGVKAVARKPRVGVFGGFSSGKSRLVNILLGVNHLPTSTEAATSAICLIRHINDKPAWQVEDVWMMRSGFDFDYADDELHCKQHKLLAGGYEAITQYGTHFGSGWHHNAFAAVVYIDTPLLLSCELLDMPGCFLRGEPEDSQSRVDLSQKMVDVMLYLSATYNFLNQNDMNYLSLLMRHLPAYEAPGGQIKPLRNLMIVATKADMIADDQIKDGMNSRAYRAFQHLNHVIAERTQLTGVTITAEDLYRRFFTFSAVNDNACVALENDLIDLLTNVLPDYTLSQTGIHIQNVKITETQQCDQRINRLQLTLDEPGKVQVAIKAVLSDEPTRLGEKVRHEQRIRTLIDKFKIETVETAMDICTSTCKIDLIQKLMQSHFGENNKEAQEIVSANLLDTIQKKIEVDLKDKASHLSHEINLLLLIYNSAIEKHDILQEIWPFNVHAVFMAKLASLDSIGALATWVSNEITGNSRKTALLTSSEIKSFSKMGLAFGGTSAAAGLLNPSWLAEAVIEPAYTSASDDLLQLKLSKRIHKQILKQEIDKKILTTLIFFWESTKSAFDNAIQKTDAIYISNLENINSLVCSCEHEKIVDDLNFSQELRDFFAGIPWKGLARAHKRIVDVGGGQSRLVDAR